MGGAADASGGTAGSDSDASEGGGTAGIGGSGGGGASAGSGGTCATGPCPPIELATTTNPLLIALDDENVYWLSFTNDPFRGPEPPWQSFVYKVSKNGGPQTLLWHGEGGSSISPPLALDVDATHVYVASAPELVMIPKSGGEAVLLFRGSRGSPMPLDVLVVDDSVYWSDGETNSGLWRVPKSGGISEPVRVGDEGATVMASTGSHAYWSGLGELGNHILFRAPLTGGPVEQIAELVYEVGEIAVAEPHVFTSGYGLVRYGLNGEAPVVLFDRATGGIALDDESAYWTENGGVEVIGRVRLDETTADVFMRRPHKTLTDIAVDSENVYWLEGDRLDEPASVMKVAK